MRKSTQSVLSQRDICSGYHSRKESCTKIQKFVFPVFEIMNNPWASHGSPGTSQGPNSFFRKFIIFYFFTDLSLICLICFIDFKPKKAKNRMIFKEPAQSGTPELKIHQKSSKNPLRIKQKTIKKPLKIRIKTYYDHGLFVSVTPNCLWRITMQKSWYCWKNIRILAEDDDLGRG